MALGGAPRPTARGLGVVLAGVGLAAGGSLVESAPLVFAGASLVALVVVVAVSLLFRSADVAVSRRFSPTRGVAGWSVVETVGIAPRGRGHDVALREQVPWRRTTGSGAVPVSLVPGRTSSAVFRHGDLPRGRHRGGPLQVDLVDAFGVARRRVVAPGVAEFVVVPEAVDLGLARESRALGDGATRQREHSLAGGEDDPITREYRRGDPMRRVHWKASARHGELMVRQEEQHGLPSVRLVVATRSDGWADASSTAEGPTSDAFEWALSVVATLGVEWGHAGSVAVVASPRGDLVARHDPDSTGAFLETLADVRLDDETEAAADPPAAREPVVAVVSGLTPLDLDSLSRSRAVGSSAVALVVSPPLGFTEAARGDAERARVVPPAEVVAALRSTGWRVVEASSDEAVGDVVREAGLLRD